jgi:hypothetical protein
VVGLFAGMGLGAAGMLARKLPNGGQEAPKEAAEGSDEPEQA